VCTDENVQRVNDMITTDWQLTVRYVAVCLKLSYGTTHCVITDVLRYNKGCARWVLRMLTRENKQVCLTTSRDNLRQYNEDPAKFLHRYVTMDETWAYHFHPETQAAQQAVEACQLADASQVSQDCLCWQSHGVSILG